MIPVLCMILFLLMALVGGNRGIDFFIALIRTMLALVISIYLIAWGGSPIPVTCIVSIFFLINGIYFQNGRNVKMHAAAFSVSIILIFILAAAGPVLWNAGMSGYNEIEQYEEISMYLSPDLAVSMSAVSLITVVLGLLGAVMDTAVAITTATNEVYVNHTTLSEKELFRSGLAVGKDVLGTTVNTLFFAGLGEGLMLAVLFMKNEDGFAAIFNSKALFQELSGLLIGAIGCILIIPLSSLVCASFLMTSKDESLKNERLLRKCYKYCTNLLKSVKNMLEYT